MYGMESTSRKRQYKHLQLQILSILRLFEIEAFQKTILGKYKQTGFLWVIIHAVLTLLVLALFSITIFSITIAVSFFVMPVIYHNLQFPYIDVDKFKRRSYRYIIFGLIPTVFALYLGTVFAFSSLIADWHILFPDYDLLLFMFFIG